MPSRSHLTYSVGKQSTLSYKDRYRKLLSTLDTHCTLSYQLIKSHQIKIYDGTGACRNESRISIDESIKLKICLLKLINMNEK